MKTRVYNEKIEINTAHTEAFWKMRAESAAEKGPEVIMCHDKCPDARAANEVFDEGYVIPRLGITSDTRILDVGCGVGRMAKMILPQCGFYCGTDFSGDMVKFAEQECAKIQGLYTEQCKFYPLSFGETVKRNTDFYGGPFDIMIVSGVCPYINDDELVQIFHHIPDLMNAHSIIYLQHPVGIETRLTLNDFYSEEMGTQYSAIYRTVKEYLEICTPLIDCGFTISEQGYKPKTSLSYSDTDRWYAFLTR